MPHDADTSARIYARALEQIGVRNRTTEHLLAHGPTAVRRSPRTPRALFARYQEWRKTEPWLRTVLQAVWRPAVEDAAASYERWETANSEQADALLTAAAEGTDAPRKAQRRQPDSRQLFISRKKRDRHHRHTVRIADNVRQIDAQTLRVPGIGSVTLDEPIADEDEVRAVTLVEKTPAARRNPTLEERTWEAHVACCVRQPLRKLPEPPEALRSAGCDHGVVHALTTCDQGGASEHLHYEPPKQSSVREWNRADRAERRCKRRSRRWRKLTRKQAAARRHACNRRQEQRRAWATRIARTNDIVGIEQLRNTNMRRTARGTSEQPGSRVGQRGLNRRLAAMAPGEQTTELVAACRRAGTRYRLVPAWGTSIECARCGHRARENRESQAGFRCRGCGHTDNADRNAAENIRQAALRHYGAEVGRSPGNRPRKSPPWETAMTSDRAAVATPQGGGQQSSQAPKRGRPGDTTKGRTQA